MSLSDEDWACRGAPDAKSAGMASHVQECVLAAGTPPEVYLMNRHGLSRAQAEEIVEACRPRPKGFRRLWLMMVKASLFVLNFGRRE
jgi:hypothetical protein